MSPRASTTSSIAKQAAAIAAAEARTDDCTRARPAHIHIRSTPYTSRLSLQRLAHYASCPDSERACNAPAPRPSCPGVIPAVQDAHTIKIPALASCTTPLSSGSAPSSACAQSSGRTPLAAPPNNRTPNASTGTDQRRDHAHRQPHVADRTHLRARSDARILHKPGPATACMDRQAGARDAVAQHKNAPQEAGRAHLHARANARPQARSRDKPTPTAAPARTNRHARARETGELRKKDALDISSSPRRRPHRIPAPARWQDADNALTHAADTERRIDGAIRKPLRLDRKARLIIMPAPGIPARSTGKARAGDGAHLEAHADVCIVRPAAATRKRRVPSLARRW
ncbi:hypothetical protein C8J57DRAFT_1506959 [Mycena rebaudengoi]|nr:hypothetical protein C8J57DRAFT_1506959 [Mycena rebaudengoi]